MADRPIFKVPAQQLFRAVDIIKGISDKEECLGRSVSNALVTLKYRASSLARHSNPNGNLYYRTLEIFAGFHQRLVADAAASNLEEEEEKLAAVVDDTIALIKDVVGFIRSDGKAAITWDFLLIFIDKLITRDLIEIIIVI